MVLGKKKPAIVKELRDGAVTPTSAGALGKQAGSGGVQGLEQHEAGRGRGFRWLLQSGRWRRPYGVFTIFMTAFGGLAVLETQTRSPVDAWGREHVFTGLYYMRERLIDRVLGITQDKVESSQEN